MKITEKFETRLDEMNSQLVEMKRAILDESLSYLRAITSATASEFLYLLLEEERWDDRLNPIGLLDQDCELTVMGTAHLPAIKALERFSFAYFDLRDSSYLDRSDSFCEVSPALAGSLDLELIAKHHLLAIR